MRSYLESKSLDTVIKDVVLVVGNGLALDLRASFDSVINPSQPLSINIIPEHHFWDGFMADLDFNVYFPHLMEIVSRFRLGMPAANDFSLIESILSTNCTDAKFTTNHVNNENRECIRRFGSPVPFWTHENRKGVGISQLRLYLLYVFSYFNKTISDDIINTWRWKIWLDLNKFRISQIISFNYDIIIERAVSAVSRANYVLSKHDVNSRISPLLISKPHGSINHTVSNCINTGQVYWNMAARNAIAGLIQGPINVLEQRYLYESREFSDIILPTEAPGARRKMRHIEYGYKRLERVGRNTRFLVIAGLSYGKVDQPEINFMIDSAPNANIFIVDPFPSTCLLKHLTKINRNFTVFRADLPEFN